MKLMSDILKVLSHEISSLVSKTSESVVTVRGYSLSLTDSSVGSGWVFQKGGVVVTNYHVIDGMREPLVLLDHNNTEHRCQIIGFDPSNDLAVLKAKTLQAKPLRLESIQPRVGSLCIAVGSPLGLRESASLGIISGLDRQERHPSGILMEDMLQTDASINPGNSGGPLVSVDGFVIGVNTMGTGQNINFSVSASTVLHVVPELIEHGSVKRAALGVSISDEHRQLADQGVMVMSSRDESSQLQAGDLIQSFDGHQLLRKVDLMRRLNRSVIGKTVNAVVLRDGKQKSIEIVPYEKL